MGVCITKDLSRLGRNSSLTGLYINFTFPKYNVRYIAINDHFDTIAPNSTDSDIAGIKNWFNEFFAKDTSRKIRAVQKAKGERGVPLTTNVPFGYLKDPADKTKWIVDEAAAVVVKRIFKLCMEGRGPMQIAKLLQEEKVLNPTAYKRRAGIKIDALYNYRQGDIHSAEFSDEFNKLCIPFEDTLSEEQIDVFHKILDCVSETAAAEMRAAYKVGFKDGVALIKEIQE